jgi:divalent metal cation (Fe/Co/Zn/Cd) transporter
VIGIDVVYDGQKYLRESVGDLMDDRPKTYDEGRPHPLLDTMKEELAATGWISEAVVRMREAGHVLTGDVWVVPRSQESLTERVEQLTERLHSLDWRIHDVVVSPVSSIEGAPEETRVRADDRGSAPHKRVTGERRPDALG